MAEKMGNFFLSLISAMSVFFISSRHAPRHHPHFFHVDKFQFFSYGLRYFFHISFILFRKQDLLDPELAGGKNFLLSPADGETSLVMADSSWRYRLHPFRVRCRRMPSRRAVIPAEGPSFGTAPSKLDMGIQRFIEIFHKPNL